MLRISATSGLSQSQSSIAVSAPTVIPVREPVAPVVSASEPETKVSEPTPSTESRTFLGLRV